MTSPATRIAVLQQLLEVRLPSSLSSQFRQYISKTVSLSKQAYLDTVVPRIDEYVLTEKADGIRTLLVVDEQDPARSFAVTSRNALTGWTATPDRRAVTILDAEALESGDYLCFDVLMWKGRSLLDTPFRERLRTLGQLDQLAAPPQFSLRQKQYQALTKAGFCAQIRQFYARALRALPYAIDGLIFTPVTRSYRETQSLKWKPPTHLSVDFLAIQDAPSGPRQFRLFCGMTRDDVHKFGVVLRRETVRALGAFHGQNKAYQAVPFCPSLAVYTESGVDASKVNVLEDPGNLHGKIAECVWDAPKAAWRLLRVRTDMDEELHRGVYFGNNHRVAELTFMTILHPLTLEFLVDPQGATAAASTYFQKSDQAYKAVRRFNNYVKSLSVQRTLRTPGTVLDLASGKGQDLHKYFTHPFCKRLILVERDADAIDEIVQRKYTMRIAASALKEMGTALQIVRADLTVDLALLGDRLDALVTARPLAIFCQFAIHYFVRSLSEAQRFVRFVAKRLRPGEEFVFTSFDGRRVFEWLRRHEGRWASKDGRFLLERAPGTQGSQLPASLRGFGTEIRVQLPCRHEPYQEFLVDFQALDKLFQEQGMFRSQAHSFSEFAETNPRNPHGGLDDEEQEFVGLYSVVGYRKAGSPKAEPP